MGWFKDDAPVEHLLIYWSYWVLLKQRDLGLADLARAAGISKQAMSQHWQKICESYDSRDKVEDAIKLATEAKALGLQGSEAIYSAAGVDKRQALVYTEVVRKHVED